MCGYYIGKKLYVGGAGPGNYTNLAEAVEDSRDGDIIYVYNGTYEGNVEIQNSIDIIGQGAKTTNITNEDTGPVITVYEDYTYIQGLSIKNTCKNWCSTGVYIYSDYSVLIDNEISDNNGYAIGLKNAAWTDIFYNKIDNNTNGVMIWGVSPDVRVHHNTITNNQGSGITLSAKTDYACIKYNLISNNQYGIYTQVGGKADTFGNPSHTNVYNNIFSENDYGIYLNIYSKYNKFIKNEFNNNKVGLYIGVGSTFNRIVKNNYWDSKSINLGPKIIKGTMRNIPWKPSITVYNIDLLPAKNPYEITL